jgi:hypothetical protein
MKTPEAAVAYVKRYLETGPKTLYPDRVLSVAFGLSIMGEVRQDWGFLKAVFNAFKENALLIDRFKKVAKIYGEFFSNEFAEKELRTIES